MGGSHRKEIAVGQPAGISPCSLLSFMSSHSSPPTNHGGTTPKSADQLERLFRSEAPRLRRFFHRRTGDSETAQDLTQEAFLRLTGSPKYCELANPLAYLQRIARNLLIDRGRRKAAMLAVVHLPYDENIGPCFEADQNYAIEANDLLARYELALESLGTKSSRIFLLHRVDELTYSQISDLLEISIGTVEYHMSRALSHLDLALGND